MRPFGFSFWRLLKIGLARDSQATNVCVQCRLITFIFGHLEFCLGRSETTESRSPGLGRFGMNMRSPVGETNRNPSVEVLRLESLWGAVIVESRYHDLPADFFMVQNVCRAPTVGRTCSPIPFP
jgi:hypothetical protein